MKSRLIASLAGALLLAGCSSRPPITVVPHVDLPRFMGDWYVIANIPTFIEKGAHNAVESYRMNPDGTIATTFTFRQDSFTGPQKRHEPTGFVLDQQSNAIWGMRFIWPIKADYRIVYLNPEYTQTIIGREKRDYVWIMARTPSIPEAEYQKLIELLRREGYDVANINKVPQQW
ncbi:MAG: lipocalin family protein [Methylococcaceae bacterium]|nr:lipocalin family protein [Methylococcaceae bacterium]